MPADVVIVGAGPAGLAAAVELRRQGVREVIVIERESRAGGIPRHAEHFGFGIRDLRRFTTGPRYAEYYRRLARASGVQLREETQATGWAPDGGLELTSPHGREELTARAFLLATGCRERPRAARLVGGTRPAGVITTGELQQRVYLHRERIGGRAVVVGAEHVSFSAIETLHRGGAKALALVTEWPRHQSFGVFRVGARLRYGTPVWTRTRVRSILGVERVEAVELEGLGGGERWSVACERVVFTADWIPDVELAAQTGCQIDPGTRGPRVAPDGRTSGARIWSAGNLVHPAETADVAALGGRHVAAALAAHLARRHDHASPAIDVDAQAPLRWITPSRIVPGIGDGQPPRGRFLLRSDAYLRAATVAVRQDERELWRGQLALVVPGRSAWIPGAWLAAVDPRGGPVRVGVDHR